MRNNLLGEEPRYLYHSSPEGGITSLAPKPLPPDEGFTSGDTGVWATDDLILSRVFGIDGDRFGHFYVDPHGKLLELIDWKLAQIPKAFVAYTYYLDPKSFALDRDWKYVSRRPVRVVKAEPYRLRDELLRHFEIWELSRTRVNQAV